MLDDEGLGNTTYTPVIINITLSQNRLVHTLTETILEAAGEFLKMAHAASTGSLATDALDTPVVGAHLGSRVSALTASLLLLVEGAVAAATAQGVRLGVAFTEAGSTLGLERGRRVIRRMDGERVDSIPFMSLYGQADTPVPDRLLSQYSMYSDDG